MAKRQADSDLEEGLRSSPASKKPRFDDAASRNGHMTGREWEQDERNQQDILAAADLESAELQEAEQSRSDSPDYDEERPVARKRQSEPLEGYGDLYLDTINRAVLDFDFEKLCSISLSNINVYACLVCGKYFQGRGSKSHAYFHALEIGHHVFVNMETKKVYVLPEGYEVKSKSLDDIKYVVDPTFAKYDVVKLDKEIRDAWDLLGKKYRPGKNSVASKYFSTVLTSYRICRNE
jgi:U4/U6.U5 tri-snRNP-associated protein 2